MQYYIDVAKEYQIDERGMPYFDDLYLDVVLLPNGDIYLLDEDELEEAYRDKDVSKEEYDVAWTTAKWLIETMKKETLSWFAVLETEIQKTKCNV